MNKTTIEWCDYTWNPIVGCKQGCSYCYAKKMNDRFKFIGKWTEPKFFKDRLTEPYKLKKPSTIFVGSMSDVLGNWIPHTWIDMIIKVSRDLPQHTFMFLTKNPDKYRYFDFPYNCKVGMTLTDINNHKTIQAYDRFKSCFVRYKFVSIEPILSGFDLVNFEGINMVIVGAMTGHDAVIPKKEWIDSIKHHNIFWKDNIKKYRVRGFGI